MNIKTAIDSLMQIITNDPNIDQSYRAALESTTDQITPPSSLTEQEQIEAEQAQLRG